MKKYSIALMVGVLPFSAFAVSLKMEELKAPPGFQIDILTDSTQNARQMALGDEGTVFVGTNTNIVYAIIPSPDFKNNQVKRIASHLNQPQGVAFYKGDLYVAELDRILCYKNIEKNLNHPPKPIVVTTAIARAKSQDGSKQSERHAWKTIKFGDDGKLYAAVGIPCNTCLPKNKYEGTIVRMNRDGSQLEIYAKGVRNSVGFDWQPATHKLWFTDNGRDEMGDEIPPDRLNYAPKKGLDFGFPSYLGSDAKGEPIFDPVYGKIHSLHGITREKFNLPAHVAVLNMVFYSGKMFPKSYQHQIFIAEHGSWDRSKKIGYRISLVRVNGDKALSYEPFLFGWMKNEEYWGRPVGLLVLRDGSMLVSDDHAGAIYRISYKPTQ